MEVAPRHKVLVHCLNYLNCFQRSPVCTAYTVFIVYTAFIAKTLARMPILLGKVRAIFEWADGLLIKVLDG